MMRQSDKCNWTLRGTSFLTTYPKTSYPKTPTTSVESLQKLGRHLLCISSCCSSAVTPGTKKIKIKLSSLRQHRDTHLNNGAVWGVCVRRHRTIHCATDTHWPGSQRVRYDSSPPHIYTFSCSVHTPSTGHLHATVMIGRRYHTNHAHFLTNPTLECDVIIITKRRAELWDRFSRCKQTFLVIFTFNNAIFSTEYL